MMKKIHNLIELKKTTACPLKISLSLIISFWIQLNLNAQPPSGFQFFPVFGEENVHIDPSISELNKTPIIFGYFTFISDMEGSIWVENQEYPVLPNQPTENLPVPASFKYSFVTKDKAFITQELGKKIHPAKKEENDTILLAIKKDFDHFIKTAKEAKIAKEIYNEISNNMVPISLNLEMSKYEVTYQQYAQFIFETGYKKEESTIDASLIIKNLLSFTNQRAQQSDISWRHNQRGKLIKKEETAYLKHPIINISWYEAQQFCQWLSGKEEHFIYRLPTVQEWENAAATTITKKDWYQYANLADNNLKKLLPNKKVAEASDGFAFTSPVGSFQPNQLGIYDMYGNVAEWTVNDLANPYINESRKIIKGGSYFVLPSNIFKDNPSEYAYSPNKRHSGIGFRIVREQLGHSKSK